MSIPYASQPTACFSTIIIQFGGGDGQVQMLDPKKPQSICSWLPKTEFLTSWSLGFFAKRLHSACLPRKDQFSTQMNSPWECGDYSAAALDASMPPHQKAPAPEEALDRPRQVAGMRGAHLWVDTTAVAAGSAKPGWAAMLCSHFCGYVKSSCQLRHIPRSFQP